MNTLINAFVVTVCFVLLYVVCLCSVSHGQTGIIVAAGGERHSIALREDGTVWGWGDNGSGQVGNGEVGEPQLNPVQVIELTGYLENITAIAAGTSYWLNQGGHTLALKNDGTVWAWGYGLSGQLGDGAGISRSIPVQMVDTSDPTGYLTGIVAIGAGDEHSMAVKNDGIVWTCGSNDYGQIGDGTNEETFTPVPVSGLTNAKAVAGGAYHTLALKNDGTVWAWGANGSGQLGDGTTGWPASKTTPVQVLDSADPTGYLTNIIGIAAGDEHSLALKSDGTVWAWGGNPFGQLGDGTWGWPESKTTPVQVLDPADPTGYLNNIVAIAGGDDYSLALKGDGTVWGFGRNNWAQLGNGTHDDTNTLVQVSGLANAVSIAAGNGHSLATKSDGTIWGWGANWSGQLGDGTFEERVTLVQTIFLDQEDTKSLITLRGPHFITPGEEVTYMVHYENILDETLEDTIVILDLPGELTYLSSTNNGIYRDEQHEVFWKLGSVNLGDVGYLAVKMEVPWGLPSHLKGNVFVNIGARNIASNIDIDDYLDHSKIEIVSWKDLTDEEINTLLSLNKELKDLLDYAIDLGYVSYNMVRQSEFNDGSSVIQFILLDSEEFHPVFLYKVGDTLFLEKYHKNIYSVFDEEGGYSEDLNDGSFNSWGKWAESHSLSFSGCVFNCMIGKLPEITLGKLGALSKILSLPDCIKCAGGDKEACIKCIAALKGIPGVGEALYVRDCVVECGTPEGLKKHECKEGQVLKYCKKKKNYGYIDKAISWASDAELSFSRRCNATLGIYGAEVRHTCAAGDICKNKECRQPCRSNNRSSLNLKCSTSISTFSISTASCIKKAFEILTAHDPNAKSVDFTGDVILEQPLTYTLEYENEGAGIAYGVFIIDELSTQLDESTLVINDGGEYSEASRILSWDIGEVPPGGQGEVTFSVNVKDGLSSGTEIINYADVHFPSASEITPTNAVVNIVNTTAADPQKVTTTSGTPVPITLTGRDEGGGSLTYEVTDGPFYGSLTGTAPNLSYTSMDEWSGQDEFYFVVSGGGALSNPARVIIRIDPNPSDTNSPEVTDTYPEEGATDIHVNPNSVSEDLLQYTPTITATFSEPIDAETVTGSTFTVDGLTGSVYYNEQSRKAYFIPSTALSPSTTYTIRLSTGIKDKTGNPMASAYSWQFSTESPANIAITLPDNADEVNFGDVLINSTSPGEIVNIASTGATDLLLASIMLTGTDSGEFRITDDNCSGMTLVQSENCTVKVVCEPVSTGIKDAHLSISSNDTDESTVEVTLSGTGVRKGLWPALYNEMWGAEEGKNTLTTLRSFRDTVLSVNKPGEVYVRSMYSNSPEIARLMMQHPSLTLQVRNIIHELLPGIQNLLEDNSMIVTEQQLVPIELLLDEFESKAGPDLKLLIKTLRDDIHTGEIFQQLGVVVN